MLSQTWQGRESFIRGGLISPRWYQKIFLKDVFCEVLQITHFKNYSTVQLTTDAIYKESTFYNVCTYVCFCGGRGGGGGGGTNNHLCVYNI